MWRFIVGQWFTSPDAGVEPKFVKDARALEKERDTAKAKAKRMHALRVRGIHKLYDYNLKAAKDVCRTSKEARRFEMLQIVEEKIKSYHKDQKLRQDKSKSEMVSRD